MSACWLLPSDFASLPLEQKVAAYVRHFHNYGRPSPHARSLISWHGWLAADAMVQYVSGQKKGLPETEAIDIIYAVQVRGCSLRGTAAECAVKSYLARTPKYSAEAISAKATLDAINRDVKFGNGGFDELRGGPCDPQGPQKLVEHP
jgi:hypothetical protein